MRSRRAESGFTLMELMIVVAIVGILAAIAVPSFTSYIHKSRTTEATSFLAEIKQRQESYRAEFNQYANVATPNPAAMPSGGEQRGWGAPAPQNWLQLGASPDGAVRFQFDTFAGLPGAGVAGGLPGCGNAAGGVVNTEFWFVAQAIGDLDGDGVTVCFDVTSHRESVWVSNSAGWE
ncbi:MAG: prepilin-type N-terminal cleavage/methylation domain-containing protein [Sandaracinus sp.]|nr:prepilin-type N-terminal cleavage/methylation domain-containing protein [Sandaracinus sp.]MCB9619524.1 prepilin-type N-terminal cleavage/methylation domain-containing protein [Sandaracinus sp.]MCB9634934.1 prepilin-type N-terminal cleavage/methylation domain-containing protein [Sandaracinus sp.]